MVVSAGMPSVVDSDESRDHIRLIPNDSNGNWSVYSWGVLKTQRMNLLRAAFHLSFILQQ